MASPDTHRVPERQVVQLLLVRATEEHSPPVFSGEEVAAATAAALRAHDELDLLEKRSAYLYLRLPAGLRSLARAALLPEDLIGVVLGLAMIAGMLSNYLGPSGSIHVAYNPLSVLLLWNLAVLSGLGWRRIRHSGGSTSAARSQVAPPVVDRGAAEANATPRVETMRDESRHASRNGGGRMVRLYLRWRVWLAKVDGARASVQGAGAIASEFLQSYRVAAEPILAARVATLLHVGAIGMLGGALVGTYLRGMFFDYNAVWRSTFLVDAAGVTTFLNCLLGPASLMWNGSLLSADQVAPLLGPVGSPAGPWIHLLAITLGLFVVPMRVVLALLAARRAKRASQAITIDLADPYYAQCIHSVRDGLGLRLREGVATAFTLEVAKLSESAALFVCERFFDKIVAPLLLGFRNRGGRIVDLEAQLKTATLEFGDSLQEHLRAGQRDLQRALSEQVRLVIGREVQPRTDALAEASPTSLVLDSSVTSALAESFGDAIGATVTTAVAAAVATLSGGLGKSIGIAVLSGLLGTSGPIGLLIGGISAVAVVGGAYLLGRDQIAVTVKGWSIPASVLSLALRDAKITEARQATYMQIRAEIEQRLHPKIGEVTGAILAELPIRVAERPVGAA